MMSQKNQSFTFKALYFSLLFGYPILSNATQYVFPGPAGPGETVAVAPITLQGATADSLHITSSTFTTNGTPTVNVQGNTSILVDSGATISNGTTQAITGSQTLTNQYVFITNHGTITGAGGAIISNSTTFANGTYCPMQIDNYGLITELGFSNTVTLPYIINNFGGAIIGNTGQGLSFGNPGSINNLLVTVNNDGTVAHGSGGTESIRLFGTAGDVSTITVNNNATLTGDILNGAPSNSFILILNAGNGSTLTGNFIANTQAQGNQYNVVAGSGGSVTLGGNLQDVNTIQIQSGSFNSNSNSITGFTTFTVSSGATATINGTFTSSATGTLSNSGTLNMQSDMTISGTAGFTNSGVLAPSGSRTLNSNFTETSNGVMAFTLTTPTNYDNLTVNGTQSIDPSSFITLAVNNMGSGIPTGTTFDIFRGTSPPNLPQFNSSGLFTFKPAVVGNDILVTLTSTTSLLQAASQNGATPSVVNLAVAVEQILNNPSLQNTALVQQLLIPLVNLSTTSAITSALNQLIFQQNAVVPTASTNAMVTSNSAQRQLFAFLNQEFRKKNEIAAKSKSKEKQGTKDAQSRQGTPGTTVSPSATQTTQTQALHNTKPLGYIAGDFFNSKLMYGATFYGSQERQRARQPYDYPFITKTGGLAFLTQAALTEKYTAGIGLSYANTYCRTYNLGAGSTDPTRIQSYQMTFLNTYLLPDDQICIEFDLSFAQNKVHQINHIFFGAPPSVGGFGVVDFQVTGDYHSKQSNAQLVVSKNYPIVSLDVYFVPTILLAVNHLNRAAYTDNNPDPPAQLHSGSKITSVLLGFGASVSKDQRNEKNETIVTYEGHIMGYRELHPKPTLEIDQFVDGGPTFISLGIKPFANTINLGGSITMPLSARFNFTGAYDLYLKRKYTNNAITIKFNWVH